MMDLAQYVTESANRIVEGDPHGDVLPLVAGSNGPEVRFLTAMIDVAWGLRDYLRGPKRYNGTMFGPCRVGEWFFS